MSKLKELRITKGVTADNAVYEMRKDYGYNRTISTYRNHERGAYMGLNDALIYAHYYGCTVNELIPLQEVAK